MAFDNHYPKRKDCGGAIIAARRLIVPADPAGPVHGAEVDRLRKRIKQCAVWYIDEESGA